MAKAQEKDQEPVNAITLQQLNAKLDELAKVRDRVEDLKGEYDAESKVYEELKRKVLSYLKEANVPNYGNARIKVSQMKRWSCIVPKEPTKRQEFFEYLKTENLFDSHITVHSQTLNSLYKSKLEEAKERGDVDWVMPGVGEPNLVETLQVRRK